MLEVPLLQVNRPRELIHMEVWDTIFPRTFLVCFNLVPLAHAGFIMSHSDGWF